MTGIKLNINEEGDVELDTTAPRLECFGGYMCTDLVIQENPTVYLCKYRDKPVNSFYYGSGKCPAGHWIKLALPCGAQNLTKEERRKWYAEQLDHEDSESNSEDPVQTTP